MLQMIYMELISIRKELQEIKKHLESCNTSSTENVSQRIREHFQEAALRK